MPTILTMPLTDNADRMLRELAAAGRCSQAVWVLRMIEAEHAKLVKARKAEKDGDCKTSVK